MFVTHKPRRGTGRLRATLVALPFAACLLATPAQASEPNGNACGHFKLAVSESTLSAGVNLSGSKTSKCAPTAPAAGTGDPAATPPAGTTTGGGTTTGDGTGGDSPGDPSGAFSVPTLRTAVLLFSGKTVGVPLACPASAPADCTGTVRITVTVPTARRSARSASVQAARRGRKLTVGKASFRLAPGQKKTVAVRISRRGRVLFNKKPSVNAQVGLETRDSAGRKRVTRKTVRIRRAKGARR